MKRMLSRRSDACARPRWRRIRRVGTRSARWRGRFWRWFSRWPIIAELSPLLVIAAENASPRQARLSPRYTSWKLGKLMMDRDVSLYLDDSPSPTSALTHVRPRHEEGAPGRCAISITALTHAAHGLASSRLAMATVMPAIEISDTRIADGLNTHFCYYRVRQAVSFIMIITGPLCRASALASAYVYLLKRREALSPGDCLRAKFITPRSTLPTRSGVYDGDCAAMVFASCRLINILMLR